MHFVEGYGLLNLLQNALDVLHVLDTFFAFFKAPKYDAMRLDGSDDLDGEIDLVGQAEEQVMPAGGFAQLDERWMRSHVWGRVRIQWMGRLL